MHGVVLRPPDRLTTTTSTMKLAPANTAPTEPPRPTSPMKNIEQLMAEADPVHTLRQTGSIRLLKRLTPESAPLKALTETPPQTAPKKLEPGPSIAASPPSEPVASALPPTRPPFPPFQPAAVLLSPEPKKADPIPAPPAPAFPASIGAPPPEETPFILKPAATPASIPKILPPTAPSLTPFGSIFRRKAKMADVARIVLPPKREEHEMPPAPSESSPTVVPPAFPVAAMTARVSQPPAESLETGKASSPFPGESVASEKIVAEEKPSQPNIPSVTGNTQGSPAEISPQDKAPGITLETEKPAPQTDPASTPTPVAEARLAAPMPDLPDVPKVDPEAHKPEPSTMPLPKVDPEAHRAPPISATPIPQAESSVPIATPEKREFHLANGERVAGTVLSETPEAVYLEHGTLGVLTIPRAQIAKRLVEIILINGDRIVGDIMAETADTLYVRHASLGMLTVPRAQRSTRVVEAILKDGDRILGEVLTETDSFTVIRSATLGTITVPHGKVSMLNRKIEQIELKALPPPAPEIKDKPSL
jgi:RNase P/RNase MRP subunit p29